MSKDKPARWRQLYTGEPYTAALEWYRRNGLYNGLVPDAEDPRQQRLEAAVLAALARPSAIPAPPWLRKPLLALEGVTPDVDALTLRPASRHLPHLLASLLPARTADGFSGLPGLRAHFSRSTGQLTLGRMQDDAVIIIRAAPQEAQAALHQARALVVDANLEPLWDSDHMTADESTAWEQFDTSLPPKDWPVWSQALRRIGLVLGEKAQIPDWSSRPPTVEEVAGPNPARLQPKAIGGAAGTFGGVVAVTPADGRGGRGCTTAAIAMSAAFARGGSSVALLFDAEDPNNPFWFVRARPPAAGTWADDDFLSLPVGGKVRGGAVPADSDQFVADARTTCDVVIVDTGNGFRNQHLLQAADVILALIPYRHDMWTETSVTDCRPDWVQCLAWLDREYAEYVHDQKPSNAMEKLVTFLDVQFAWHLLDGLGGDDEIYDATDPDAVDAWWDDYDYEDETALFARPDEEDLHDDEPSTDADVNVDEWREEFLSFLSVEGLRRHPVTWEQACAEWRSRSRARTVRDVIHGSLDGGPATYDEFLQAIADEATSRWGSLWEQQAPIWEAAREAGDDLVSEWDHLVEIRRQERTPDEIAGDLNDYVDIRDLRRVAPAAEIITGVAGVTRPIGHYLLEAVGDVLNGQGVTGLVVIPDLQAFKQAAENIELLSRRGGTAAAAANRIAHAVAKRLHHRARM